MKKIEDCTVGLVGLGLMGGAFAAALGRIRAGRVLACDIDPAALRAGVSAGAIREGFSSPEGMLNQCDLVFLCLNPSSLIRFMERHMADFAPGTLITDIGGVKTGLVRGIEKRLPEDLDFIPGHPMAGSEKSGYAQSNQCSFQGKNYILTPLKRNKPENVEFLKSILFRMGFSRITETTPEDHDRKIAFTSQLSHVIAAALIDCESDPEIIRFGGGSFEDLTRIAMLNVPLWTELFLENRLELLPRITQFQGSLEKLKTCIAEERRDALEEILQTARDRRTSLI
ncbi:MAG: prephenate dehydrogenase/arogenate dehydrogenase family protein [Spirochaetaceae bacterium]|jgi:prephenate dehydrogenase|nr:prephenate dehydrogenase/arogenate dehydrogenase family protein [Spirochaetaceae bacterium]